MVTRSRGGGVGEFLLNRVSIWDEEKLLEIDSDDSYSTL